MKPQRVITDTNIWYGIGQKNIIFPDNSNIILCVPLIVLSEIYSSPNAQKSQENFDMLISAVKSILNYKEKIEIIDIFPFEYILKYDNPNIKYYGNAEFYFKEFEAMIQLKYEDVKNVPPIRASISTLTQFINETSKSYKKIISANSDKFKKTDTIPLTESLLLKYINDCRIDENKAFPELKIINKKEFQLLLNTFDSFLREVSKTNKKITDNDWIDLFNLVYVGKYDLFWTKEKRLKKRITELELEKYLFEK